MAIIIDTAQINAKFLGGRALNKIMLGAIEIFPNIGGTPPAWDPSDLFAANDDGLYYNFNVIGSLFQNSIGTTTVTAVEQPIGAVIDLSKKGALGAETLADPTFNNPGEWSLGTNVSINNNQLIFADAPHNTSANNASDAAMVTGKAYSVTVDVESLTGTLTIVLGGLQLTIPSVGQHTFTAIPFGPWKPSFTTVGTTSAVINSYSVKEQLGNAATQPTAASRFLFTALKNFVASSQWNTLTLFNGVTAATNSAAPDGTMTAARLHENANGGAHGYNWGANVGSPRGVQTYSVVVKPEERSCLRLRHSDTGSWATCEFDTVNMVVGAAVNCTGTVTPHPLGGGWVICSLTRTRNSGGGGGLVVDLLLELGVDSYQGVPGYGLNVAWQQSEMGAVRTSYQSVVSPTDYDTNGFPTFARSDGVDDFLTTIPFQNISLVGYTLVLGVIYDSVNTNQFAVNNDGAVRVAQNTRMNSGANNSLVFNSAGTPFTTSGAGSSVAGEYEVVTVRCSSTLLELSINGNPAGSVAVTGDLQTAVQALVISSSGNRLNGRITGLVIINRYLSNSELLQTQNFIEGLYTP